MQSAFHSRLGDLVTLSEFAASDDNMLRQLGDRLLALLPVRDRSRARRSTSGFHAWFLADPQQFPRPFFTIDPGQEEDVQLRAELVGSPQRIESGWSSWW